MWQMVLWSHETLNYFDCYKTVAVPKNNTHTMSTVKHSGGSILLMRCFSPVGKGYLAIANLKMDGAKQMAITEGNLLRA